MDREHDCLLVARARNGQTLDFHTGKGQVTVAQLHACVKPVLPADVLLISDGAMAYRRFTAQAGFSHEAVNERAGIPDGQRVPDARRLTTPAHLLCAAAQLG